MKQSSIPLWKKSIIQNLDFNSIVDWLYEIDNNGDAYGYDREESGYYNDYKELFDELAEGAYKMLEAIDEYDCYGYLSDHWDDMVVALLGKTHNVLGYDTVETDYFMLSGEYEENRATEEAIKRIKRLSKDEIIHTFQKVLRTLVLFFDLKASHDCLTAIVDELDEKGALLSEKNNQINILYEDLTGKNGEDFDRLVENLPQRMWVE